MEKRNVIQDGRTPDMTKQGDADMLEKQAVLLFTAYDAVHATVLDAHCGDTSSACKCAPCCAFRSL
jgi:hypothetical protein